MIDFIVAPFLNSLICDWPIAHFRDLISLLPEFTDATSRREIIAIKSDVAELRELIAACSQQFAALAERLTTLMDDASTDAPIVLMLGG